MNLYVGLTDYDCYTTWKEGKVKEINFWRPGNTPFKALRQDELFLFRLKKPFCAIVGGGYFIGYSRLPIDMVWDIFGVENGIRGEKDFFRRVVGYQQKRGIETDTSLIGNIVLAEPFFFEPDQWIRGVEDWSDSIVTGKKYSTGSGEGEKILAEVLARLQKRKEDHTCSGREIQKGQEPLTGHRPGDGAFRMLVTDAYDRTCAVSGSKILPILKAAHLKPVSEGGPNTVDNGILLRSDLCTLLERGYLTVDSHYILRVSSRLRQDFEGTGQYEQYHGKQLVMLPDNIFQLPNREYLQWHNEKVFRG